MAFNIEWLSPSAISSLCMCPKQFEFRYVHKIYSPKNGRMAVGTAYHAAVAWAYRMKQEGTPAQLVDILEVFDAAWEKGTRDVVYWQKDRPEDLKEGAHTLLSLYHPALERAATLTLLARLRSSCCQLIHSERIRPNVPSLSV